MSARPTDPEALAAAVTSSLILVYDPVPRTEAPDYWEWSADAHAANVRALAAVSNESVRTAAALIEADPSDSAAATELTRAVAALLHQLPAEGDTADPVSKLRDAASHIESLSRLLIHPGLPRPRPVAPEASAEELLTALARPPHGGTHPVDAAIVLPFRAAEGATGRVRNLAAVVNALADQDHPRDRYRVIVVESDDRPRWQEQFADSCDSYIFAPCPGLFNKSWAVNVGVVHGARPTELVCVLDADILVDRSFVSRAVERFQQAGTQAHWPFKDVLFLDQPSSADATRARCLESAPEPDHETLRGVFLRRNPGSCVWIRESLFSRIGGMDERFSGWGGEDQDFVWRTERYGPLDRHADPTYHLHHERAPHRGDDGVPFYLDVEQEGFCSWPCDSDFGRLDRYVASATT